MKFNRKWEFQVDGVNFIFSLQKISFWYNASFEFFCQILWVYNYFALKRMFSLVIACMKDRHRRKGVLCYCARAYLRAVAVPCGANYGVGAWLPGEGTESVVLGCWLTGKTSRVHHCKNHMATTHFGIRRRIVKSKLSKLSLRCLVSWDFKRKKKKKILWKISPVCLLKTLGFAFSRVSSAPYEPEV